MTDKCTFSVVYQLVTEAILHSVYTIINAFSIVLRETLFNFWMIIKVLILCFEIIGVLMTPN